VKPRTILTIVGVLAVMLISRFLLPIKALPEVSVAAEVLGRPFGEWFPFTNSILMTILVDLVIVISIVMATRKMNLVPRGAQNFWEFAVEAFYGLGESIDRRNIRRIFPLVATIFFFVAFSNFLALVPGVGSIGLCRTHEAALINPSAAEPAAALSEEEVTKEVNATGGACSTYQAEGHTEVYSLVPLLRSPSADLNTTLAIALIAFFTVEYLGFKQLGVGYLGKFFNFKEGPIMLVVGILEFISEFVRILSFTFRLFGNIFAGEVVLAVMAFLIPWLLPLPFYGLEIFVAFIQAFIFAALTLAFINQATTGHHETDEHGDHIEASPADIAH